MWMYRPFERFRPCVMSEPLQKHTLIQTILELIVFSRVKDKGLVVDYIGIKGRMMEAVKRYGATGKVQ